ncbi:sporulation membrane protein YtaF [Vulcanibacillus modesticaldus]|uniref:Sporulation membrane protein YtaF n=1 Tax=Vulcanibacillus modesticaldus TaxID=337097 RepID=A0A1D2YWR9_9BACI|nr:sporulation membrane protein YtaF [Vulcanibacillus modesticaldus]OEG00096.1 sporulation membrane protein YtaF [Vulcanibacillus modesticaldus]
MNTIYLFILALAVSLDSFGVGVTYGLRKVKIPNTSIFIISLASASMILLSMQLGVWISIMISPYLAKWIGAIILIIVGLWAIFQVSNHHKQNDNEEIKKQTQQEGKKLLSIEIKKLGLVIQILKTPMEADIDRSGKISSLEAVFLGLALSLDAFGAGLGAALVGFKPLFTAITIAGMSGLFIRIGMRLGFWFSEIKWLQKFTIVPGIILVLIGIMKFF